MRILVAEDDRDTTKNREIVPVKAVNMCEMGSSSGYPYGRIVLAAATVRDKKD
jgi:hypothetical protein